MFIAFKVYKGEVARTSNLKLWTCFFWGGVCIHVQMCVHNYVCADTCMCGCRCMCTDVCVQVHVCAGACMSAGACVQLCVCRYIYVRVHMWVLVHVYRCVCVSRAQGTTPGVIPQVPSALIFFLRQSLLLALNLLIQLNCMATEPQGSSCLRLPRNGGL